MAKLTRRQREVIALVAEGAQRSEIATRLCIEPGTVKKHIDNARRRAGAPTVAALAVKVALEMQR